MKLNDFEIVIKLPDSSDNPEVYLEDLGRFCDDAVCGIGVKGELALSFSRRGESMESSINSAKVDIEKSIPGSFIKNIKVAQ
jgi:hypothetical protein